MYGEKNKKKRVYIELDADLAREFKTRCAMHEKLMSNVLRPHIEDFLRENPPIVNKRPNID